MQKYGMPRLSLRNENVYFVLKMRTHMQRFKEHERRFDRSTIPDLTKSKHSQ